MSGKKKKPASPWVLCDKCSSYMLERDAGNHTECYNNLSHPYAQKGILHCSIDLLSDKELLGTCLSRDHLNGLIFISNAALQLCEIAIGSWVVITLPSGEKIVRRAWKGHDRLQLSASLFDKDPAASFSGPAAISVLNEPIEFAGEIVLDGDNDLSEEAELMTHLQQAHRSKVFAIGNKIMHSFYGKIQIFSIVDILPVMEGVSHKFYKSLPNTQWVKNRTFSRQSSVSTRIAGFDNILEDINAILELIMEPVAHKGGKARGILIYGLSGTGKTTLMNAIANKWGNTVVSVSSMSRCSDDTGGLYFGSLLQQAQMGIKSVIAIDDLDVICGKSSAGNDSKEAFALATLFDRIHYYNSQVVIIATTNNINAVSRCLRRPGRFDKEFEISPPTPPDREKILQSLLEDDHSVDQGDIKVIAEQAHGFVGADLAALVSKAASLASKEHTRISGEHLHRSFVQIRPSAMREVMVQVPNVKWDDVGGQYALKHQLRQAVEWPLKYPESFKRLGVSPPRGLLMYGPPGCSKTMIAKALATESGLNFLSVKGPELFSCWVGDSEKALREVFRRARQAAPAIVFFDELDALANERAGSQSGGSQVQERVLAQLLTELDGVEALGDVIVIGATNRPDRIDPALLRPGRLDRVVYVPLPDSETRKDIFSIQFRKTPVADDIDVTELVTLTEGYSGAEIVGVCREAAMDALNENIHAAVTSRKNFFEALKIVTPRTSQASLSLCEKYKNARLV